MQIKLREYTGVPGVYWTLLDDEHKAIESSHAPTKQAAITECVKLTSLHACESQLAQPWCMEYKVDLI